MLIILSILEQQLTVNRFIHSQSDVSASGCFTITSHHLHVWFVANRIGRFENRLLVAFKDLKQYVVLITGCFFCACLCCECKNIIKELFDFNSIAMYFYQLNHLLCQENMSQITRCATDFTNNFKFVKILAAIDLKQTQHLCSSISCHSLIPCPLPSSFFTSSICQFSLASVLHRRISV